MVFRLLDFLLRLPCSSAKAWSTFPTSQSRANRRAAVLALVELRASTDSMSSCCF